MLAAFKDYLTNKALVREKYVPFYLKWVSSCYAFFDEEKSNISSEASDAKEEWDLLEAKMRKALRLRQRSYSTEKTYLTWLHSFRGFVKEKDPASLRSADLQDFLSSLAIERGVSPSTQNQALNAIIFFYRHALEKDIKGELNAVRAIQKCRLPVIITISGVNAIFDKLSGVHRLMAMLIPQPSR